MQLTDTHFRHHLDSSCDLTASTGGCILASLRNIAHSELRISDHGDGVMNNGLHQHQTQTANYVNFDDRSNDNYVASTSIGLWLCIIISTTWLSQNIASSHRQQFIRQSFCFYCLQLPNSSSECDSCLMSVMLVFPILACSIFRKHVGSSQWH